MPWGASTLLLAHHPSPNKPTVTTSPASPGTCHLDVLSERGPTSLELCLKRGLPREEKSPPKLESSIQEAFMEPKLSHVF